MGAGNSNPLESKVNQMESQIAQKERELAGQKTRNAEERAEKLRMMEEISKLNNANESMRETLADMSNQMNELIASQDSSRAEYEELAGTMSSFPDLVFDDRKHIMIGPKGSGKTTFMWMRDECEKPTPSVSDGTVEIDIGTRVVDTIGVNIEISHMLKFMAMIMVLTLRGSTKIPSTIVLCSNDRVERPIQIMQHLCFENILVAAVKPDSIYSLTKRGISLAALEDNEKYHANVYDIENYKNKYIPIKATDAIPQNSNLRNVMVALFPGMKLRLPPWEHYNKKRGTDYKLAYSIEICKHMIELQTLLENDGSLIAFMNRK